MSNSAERSIFLQALEKESPAAREAYLARACAGDEQLRASVEKLLEAHQLADNPLDKPLAALDNSDALLSTLPPIWTPLDERPGTEIGPYKLREQIGEGGFGLVFVAEQRQPVRRKVAIKVIKPGMDSREVIARFEAERQALAMMDHQNIARVFDAGTTDTGRPYFVMELVRGVPITEFCDQQQLDTRQRLELFVTVCSAVQHAHQKGVIHRDIKPSNVLITLHDETPVVKVIDFGVAKAIGRSLTDKTIYTRFTAMIGTPLYMSPEQAEMSGLDVDTRSDIYSLGVLLYELLTGATPFDRERFNTAGFDEVRRIIREEDPPKPSTRLTTIQQALSTASTRRHKAPSRSQMTVPGDLDWIVMKAIEKDRQRRYESAGSFAADIRRFLSEEPVEARPPSRLYKTRKFARRNRVALVTFSLVAAAMILGTAISLWQMSCAVSERNEKEIALQEAVDARNEADEARRQVEGFTERLKEANILVTSGRAHADAERWSAAYADYTRATERQPNYYNAWMERASLEVRLGLWKHAASDYSRALELGVPADNPASWGIPQLFLLNGDEESYREYCLSVLRRAEENSETVSINFIRSCVVAAEPVTDPGELARQVEEILAASPGPRPDGLPPDGPPPAESQTADGRRPPYLLRSLGGSSEPQRRPVGERPNDPPWYDHAWPRGPRQPGPPNGDRPAWGPHDRVPLQNGLSSYIAGLAHYRAEQFDEAVARLCRAAEDQHWRERSIAYPALAMAYHRSGQGDKAKESLASAEKAIDQWTEEMLNSPVGRMPILWFDWIECLLLYREASVLLTGFTPPDDPRLREIEERSLAAIGGDESPAQP